MKKLLVLVGILAAFSLMGCGDDPVNPPASDPVVDDTPTEVVIFDPATYEGEGVEIVDLDGEKFAKVVVEGYNSYIKLPAVLKDLAITKVKGKVKAEAGSATGTKQWAVQFMTVENKSQAAAFGDQTFNVVKEYTSNYGETFNFIDYNNGGVAATGSNEVESLQVYVQDSSYQAVSGAIMYVGKIIGE